MSIFLGHRRTGLFLIGLVILLTVGLVLSVFLSTSSTANRVFSGGELVSTPPKVISARPGSGMQNDLQTKYGPWWITEDLSWLVVDNPTMGDRRISFVLSVNFGVCTTTRTVQITSQNQTTVATLSTSDRPVTRRMNFVVKPGSSTNIVFQVNGPVCQAPDDPRVFYGQVSIADFRISRT
jgi:hypothetical protein